MAELHELQWMLPPLVLCLVLTGIHGYLGIHVLSRKVIFVDLALAQIAALGTMYALLLGYDPGDPADSAAVYLFSLTFTLLGAVVFAVSRMRHERVPQEAFIGIVYASATAVAILMLSQTTAETEHIKSMLVGNVLLVTWPMIFKTTGIYAAVGIFHYVLRRRFFQISLDPEGAIADGVNIRWWDFLFYASFGIVITSSVAIAGVLLVFTYLVVPAAVGMMFADRIGRRLAIAWGVGSVCSLMGILLSYYGDLPTGPSVVSSCAVFLILAGIVYYITHTAHRGRALFRTAVGGAVTLAILAGSTMLRKDEDAHPHGLETDQFLQGLSDPDISIQIEAIHHLEETMDPHAIGPMTDLLRRTDSDRVLEHAIEALAHFGDPSVAPALLETADRDLDPFLRLVVAEGLFTLRQPDGFRVLLMVLADVTTPALARDEALDVFSRYGGHDFRVQSGAHATYESALAHCRTWWEDHRDHLRWRDGTGRFE